MAEIKLTDAAFAPFPPSTAVTTVAVWASEA